MLSWCSLSCNDFYVSNYIGERIIIKDILFDRSIIVFKRDFCANLNDLLSVNLICIENKIFAFLGNYIYEVVFDGNEGKLNYLKKIELAFTSEYLYAIENFPWDETIRCVFDRKNKTPHCNLKALSEEIATEKLNIIIDNIKVNLGRALIKNWSSAFADYIRLTVECNVTTMDDILSVEEYIYGFKNRCFPCDSGISYYDGEKSCYIHLDENFDVKYINKYYNGCYVTSYRNQIHYALTPNNYNYIQNFELWDIYKSWEQNRTERPIIPIYDLNLYKSNITDVLGISAGIKDILEKQTEIYTKYLTFDD